MRMPSVESLFAKTFSTFSRFPLAIAASIAGSVVSWILMHSAFGKSESLMHVVMVCYLGMLLFTSSALFAKRMKLSAPQNMILHGVCAALLVLYYFMLPSHLHTSVYIRYSLYALGLHLLVAFAPFIMRGEMNGFWQYNKIVFLRILTAGLYSSVLYGGIALAIVAVNQLFGVKIDGKIYGALWIFIAGIFNTWFFLAGMPENFEELDSSDAYPKGLKIFTQYVLLPLVSLYLVILYSYEIKIFFTSHWPVGWVAYLVLGFSIAGILSLLLVWPVRNDEGHGWIKIFTRFFYFALFPLILLLFLAIYKRISQYGITEHRYFVLLLALWLVFIATYFLISKAKSIKLIPVSLCLIAFLSSFGPWGAFSVSKHSQLKHFEEILKTNKMLDKSNHFVAGIEMKWDDRLEVSSVVKYLVDMHGYDVMQPYFHQNLDSLLKKTSDQSSRYSYEHTEKILGLMGLKYYGRWDTKETNNTEQIELRTEGNESVISVKGYDEYISSIGVNAYYGFKGDTTVFNSFKISRDSMKVSLNTGKSVLKFMFDKSEPISLNLMTSIDSMFNNKYPDNNMVPEDKMTFILSNNKVEIKLRITNITIQQKDTKRWVTGVNANVLLRWKQE